jgi:hypothetical protein
MLPVEALSQRHNHHHRQQQQLEPKETYEERWLKALSGGDVQKLKKLRGLPLMNVAMYGHHATYADKPHGNTGRKKGNKNA